MTSANPRNSSPSPTATLITAPGRSAIATISVDGLDALKHVARYFQPAGRRDLSKTTPRRILFGRWSASAAAAGEEIVVCVHAATRVEIHCHGGGAAANRILCQLDQGGCQCIHRDQWLVAVDANAIRRESTHALTQASTARVAAILLDQFRGALERALNVVLERLQQGDARGADHVLQALLVRSEWGQHLVSGWQVVLVGRPNVGKSSLINALLGYQRAIVFDQPGTTRDVITASTAVDGWPVEFADTAGITEDAQPIEAEGTECAWGRVASADLVLFVSDVTRPWTVEDARVLERAGGRAMIVHNKSDLVGTPAQDRPAGIFTSALQGDGLRQLIAGISERLVPVPPRSGEPVPFCGRQTVAIRAALSTLQRGDFPATCEQLVQLLGDAPSAP